MSDKPIRGRRPGAIERTTCPECGRDCAKRLNGKPFRHHRKARSGYSLSYCPGGER